MNTREKHAFLPDIQSQPDRRQIPIEAVGVKGLRYPVTVRSSGENQPTVAEFRMTVGLGGTLKGTHMSRFIELLEASAQSVDQDRFKAMVIGMLERLGAASGEIEMRFPYFIRKRAPVSGVESLVDCDVTWRCNVATDGACTFCMKLTAAGTSLCPCSKEISAYGAHNQRSHITIDAELARTVDIAELLAIAEASASCEVYGLLKRGDEKYVTERAYDNPKFVEDAVRDAALALRSDPRVRAFVVEVENFESIHNHSAFARIDSADLSTQQ
ncbi:GTP cyclohydrolase FolE2 [Massilia cavernae]|uniref:GTP cyclohydrolase FolE2 n=1 Tax=Massilia cavernae TaxID=2320864 RepID=A0A418Y5R6_9BURK|nr:GTP cyclohydrolase FolE2 [Massilia cavernae]RJG22202.1 GTP cyclohydrolase I FolE2 [Massilia cavernae]